MKKLPIGLLIFIMFTFGCNFKSSITINRFMIDTKFNLPLIMSGGEIKNVADSAVIVYFDSIVIIDKPRLCEFEFMSKDSQNSYTKIINGYFVYDTSKLYGYYYDSLFADSASKILVKEELNTLMTYNDLYYGYEKDLKQVLLSSEKNGNELNEKYLVTAVKDYTYPDTIYYTSTSKFPKTFYSLSKPYDSLTNRTLIKSLIKFNERKNDSKLNVTISKREILSEMKLINDTIPSRYIDLINRFKKKYK